MKNRRHSLSSFDTRRLELQPSGDERGSVASALEFNVGRSLVDRVEEVKKRGPITLVSSKVKIKSRLPGLWRTHWISLDNAIPPILIVSFDAKCESTRKSLRLGSSTVATLTDDITVDIQSTSRKLVLRFDSPTEATHWHFFIENACQTSSWIQDFALSCEYGPVICNSNALVRLAKSRKSSKVVVIKTTELFLKNDPIKIPQLNEAIILRRLLQGGEFYPNIIAVEKIFQLNARIHIVSEFCTEGSLFDYFQKNGALLESQAAKILSHIGLGLARIHELGIVHLDIKPENVLLQPHGDDLVAKISDFGSAKLSCQYSEGSYASLVATPLYVAPEALAACHGWLAPSADVYSAGVTLLAMLRGKHPAPGLAQGGSSLRDVVHRACLPITPKKCPDAEEVLTLSHFSKHLLLQMLEPDPKTRITVRYILQHPWIEYHQRHHTGS